MNHLIAGLLALNVVSCGFSGVCWNEKGGVNKSIKLGMFLLGVLNSLGAIVVAGFLIAK